MNCNASSSSISVMVGGVRLVKRGRSIRDAEEENLNTDEQGGVKYNDYRLGRVCKRIYMVISSPLMSKLMVALHSMNGDSG